MRMNRRAGRTAAEILNTSTEEALADLFYLYGELKIARKIAAAILKARDEHPLRTIEDLLTVVKPLVGRGEKEKKILREMLEQTTRVLKPGGRLVVMTYHSLEDRLVKNFLKTGNFEGKSEQDFFGNVRSPFRLVNNKVIVPSEDEIESNPRSRSAKLRIAEFIGD